MEPIDGFWLPQKRAGAGAVARTPSTRPCPLPADAPASRATTARHRSLACAQPGAVGSAAGRSTGTNRQRAPRGQAYWERFRRPWSLVGRRFADPADPLRTLALAALPGYTGYSEAMIRLTLGALDMWALDQFPAAFQLSPTLRRRHRLAAAGGDLASSTGGEGLSGRLRFFGAASVLSPAGAPARWRPPLVWPAIAPGPGGGLWGRQRAGYRPA